MYVQVAFSGILYSEIGTISQVATPIYKGIVCALTKVPININKAINKGEVDIYFDYIPRILKDEGITKKTYFCNDRVNFTACVTVNSSPGFVEAFVR